MLKTGYSRGVQGKSLLKLPNLSMMPSQNLPVQDHSQSSKILESCISYLVPVDPLIPITSGGNQNLESWLLRQHLMSNTMTTSAELSDISSKRTVPESLNVSTSQESKSNLEKKFISVDSEDSEYVPSWLKTGSSTLVPSMQRLERILPKAAQTKMLLLEKWLGMDLCSLAVADLKQYMSMLQFTKEEPHCKECKQPLINNDRFLACACMQCSVWKNKYYM